MKRQWMGKALLICILSMSSLDVMADPAASNVPSPANSAPVATQTASSPSGTSTPTTNTATTAGTATSTTSTATTTAGKPPAPAPIPTDNPAAKTTGLTPIAQVIWVKGNVTAAQPGAIERALARRSVIYEHDVIKTSKESSGQISFTDNSVISLSANSEMRVKAYHYTKTLEDQSVLELIKGGFRTITGAIPKENPDSYQLKTPVATIGVRGTEYTLFYSEEKGLVLDLEVGSISVTNGAGTILLSPCTGGGASCYGAVTSASTIPQIVAERPTELTTKPELVPVPKDLPPPGVPESATTNQNDSTTPAAAGSTDSSGTSGPSDTSGTSESSGASDTSGTSETGTEKSTESGTGTTTEKSTEPGTSTGTGSDSGTGTTSSSSGGTTSSGDVSIPGSTSTPAPSSTVVPMTPSSTPSTGPSQTVKSFCIGKNDKKNHAAECHSLSQR